MNKNLYGLANVFSLLRILCAPLLFVHEPIFRAFVICAAALTDYLDGYFARKNKQITKIGTLLDPLADKLFVGIALVLFFFQNQITLLECFIFLFRDWSLLLFYVWLKMTKSSGEWQIRSFVCGKLMTTCQFISLMLLSVNVDVPSVLFALMGFFGIGSFFELLWRHKGRHLA